MATYLTCEVMLSCEKANVHKLIKLSSIRHNKQIPLNLSSSSMHSKCIIISEKSLRTLDLKCKHECICKFALNINYSNDRAVKGMDIFVAVCAKGNFKALYPSDVKQSWSDPPSLADKKNQQWWEIFKQKKKSFDSFWWRIPPSDQSAQHLKKKKANTEAPETSP